MTVHHVKPKSTCPECGAQLRYWNETATDRPGTVRAAGGRCASCYARERRRAQGTRPRPVVKITTTGKCIELVRFVRTRDGIRHDLITGTLIRPTITHWVVAVDNELLELPRNEWLEALAA